MEEDRRVWELKDFYGLGLRRFFWLEPMQMGMATQEIGM